MDHLSQRQLLQLLYEKDCYIQALEQQLEFSRQEVQLLKSQKQSIFIQNVSSDEDCNIDENSEPAISDSRVEQFQSSGQKIKLKAPLQNSNNFNISQFRQSTQQVRQKALDYFDIQTATTNNARVNNEQLFDDLFILGLGQEQQNEPQQTFIVKLENQQQILSISKFILPDGCKPIVLPLAFSLEDINLMMNHNYQIDSPNCFVILTKQTEKQQLKYHICYRYNDFTVLSPLQVRFSKRAICFTTSKCLVDFYQQILIVILSQLKSMRSNLYSRTNNISLADSNYFDKNIAQICLRILSQLSQKNYPNFITINNQELKISENDNIQWGIPQLFKKLDSQSLIKIFLSCLIEKSIVFVSKSPYLSTAACLLCQKYLLKPFAWIHPIISNLPLENIAYLGSPVPIIAGIECNFSILYSQGIINKFQNAIFINLDSKQQIQFGNTDQIPLLSAELMAHLLGRLDSYFQKCQSNHSNYSQCLQIFNQLFHARVIRNIPIEPIRQNTYQTSKAINKVLLDYERIAQKTLQNMGTVNSDQVIWKQFFQTQIFIQFIDQYYH
ncbi:unnamed protein product (macronuclear) [Paramecium tetraurelia]|uniref:UDENN domain-containing protein n=1 Tax=Paramecium tetraurelia TaxID=5888 RepID=A0E7M9_PARTE|nr:uncharacterized protein GSPATT00024024001 [Paramecium tetraurelia]CAK91296.1 unnamed protein product [Paramecium tetraurelia]|eukprot:XP_001458693.1 hypothetical protein (macronuclear) [Paramecium tetraurelia strain d4-2]